MGIFALVSLSRAKLRRMRCHRHSGGYSDWAAQDESRSCRDHSDQVVRVNPCGAFPRIFRRSEFPVIASSHRPWIATPGRFPDDAGMTKVDPVRSETTWEGSRGGRGSGMSRLVSLRTGRPAGRRELAMKGIPPTDCPPHLRLNRVVDIRRTRACMLAFMRQARSLSMSLRRSSRTSRSSPSSRATRRECWR